MRHWIQKGGHELLPFLFMLVATGTGVLFYLGNFWPGTPPGEIVVPILVLLAICTEWLTFTFNQDMQDAFTARRGRGFPVIRALLTSAVSAFIFATASAGLWAPRGASDKMLWAWILAAGVFGSQFLLKLVPEKTRERSSVVNIGAAIEDWIPDASQQEKMRALARVFNAIASDTSQAPGLPAPAALPPAKEGAPLDMPKLETAESEAAKNGNGTFPQP